MKIATWNVNSLAVRLPQVLDWLSANPVDVLALQELKLVNEKFPHDAFAELGYQAVVHGQKTYNGVATLSKHPLNDISCGFPEFEDLQARCIIASVLGMQIVNVYVPNGASLTSEKYPYKLAWLEHLKYYLKLLLEKNPSLIILGDFNIAPTDEDVHDPIAWEGHVLVSPKEREALQALLSLGLHDSLRLLSQEKIYTWWDYRQGAFRRNNGLRIDHILVSDVLKDSCINFEVDKAMRKNERPSDHAPVVLEIAV